MTKTVTWVLKISKFCNLRCTYCYEWNELSDRSRMPLDLLRRCFEAASRRCEFHQSTFESVHTAIVWHGGEPLILPLPYLRDAMVLQGQVFDGTQQRLGLQNIVQTNLYTLSDALIEFLRQHRWMVGVSCDFVEGVRLSLSGKTTERRVLSNVRRLQEAGVPCHAIVVLAAHTVDRVTAVYDELLAMGFVSARFLPLFEGPPERPQDTFATTNEALVSAMCRLFAHWFDGGMRLPLTPLDEYLGNVLRRMVGIGYRLADRELDGESVVLVNTNGDVYQINDAYDEDGQMGNLRAEGIDAILASDGSRAALVRERAIQREYCERCEYKGHCNGYPVLTGKYPGSHQGRCPIAFPVHAFIESYIRSAGFREKDLAAMLRTQVRAASSCEA